MREEVMERHSFFGCGSAALCSLCLCGLLFFKVNHRDTENTEVAQRRSYLQLLLKRLALHWSHVSVGFGFSVVVS